MSIMDCRTAGDQSLLEASAKLWAEAAVQALDRSYNLTPVGKILRQAANSLVA
jgi:hypothetical protein